MKNMMYINEFHTFIYIYIVGLNIVDSIIYRVNVRHVIFNNKAIKIINLPANFNSTNVSFSLVTNKRNFITPTIVYDLTAPIRSKTF